MEKYSDYCEWKLFFLLSPPLIRSGSPRGDALKLTLLVVKFLNITFLALLRLHQLQNLLQLS